MKEGFVKVKIPKLVMDLIVDLYYLTRLVPVEIEKEENNKTKINLFNINKYPTLKSILLETTKSIHEDFSEERLEAIDCYGIKSYWQGSSLGREILNPQEYLVGSIAKVDHDAKPWPLLFKNKNGEIEEVDLRIGEMIIFNSKNYLDKRACPLEGLYSRELSFYYGRKK